MRKFLLPLAAVMAVPLSAQAAPPQPSATPVHARLTLCRPGPSVPSQFPDLRPGRTAQCPYAANDLAQRIANLLQRGLGEGFNVVSVYSAFGLPAMTTSYDSPRIAAYAMTATGGDGWKIHLTVNEAAYPLDDALPAAFVPGENPTRLAPLEAFDVDASIAIFPKEGAAGPDGCITAAWLGAFATAAGWKDQTAMSAMFVTDAGPGYPRYAGPAGRLLTFLLNRQEGQVPSKHDMETSCVTSVRISIPPKDKPAGQ